MKKPVAAALVAGSLLAGAGVGAVFFGPGPAIAQSSSDPGSSTADPNASGAPTSNETDAHETGETPEREAAENNGTAHHGGPHGPGGRMGGSNEDPAHEAKEGTDRETQEDANKAASPNSGSSSAAPNASSSTSG
jgi:hypothetical protein